MTHTTQTSSKQRFTLMRKLGLVLAGVGMLALAASPAMAGGGKGGHFFKKASARLEQAMVAVQATPDQKASLTEALQQTFATLKPLHKQMKERRLELRQLRESGSTDEARIAELRDQKGQLGLQLKAAKQVFMMTVEQKLTPPQRAALATFLQQHGEILQVHKRHKAG